MPTISFTDGQYCALLHVLSYLANEEFDDVSERYGVEEIQTDTIEKINASLKAMLKADAEYHIAFDVLKVYQALEGDKDEELEEEDEDEKDDEEERLTLCHNCGDGDCSCSEDE